MVVTLYLPQAAFETQSIDGGFDQEHRSVCEKIVSTYLSVILYTQTPENCTFRNLVHTVLQSLGFGFRRATMKGMRSLELQTRPCQSLLFQGLGLQIWRSSCRSPIIWPTILAVAGRIATGRRALGSALLASINSPVTVATNSSRRRWE